VSFLLILRKPGQKCTKSFWVFFGSNLLYCLCLSLLEPTLIKTDRGLSRLDKNDKQFTFKLYPDFFKKKSYFLLPKFECSLLMGTPYLQGISYSSKSFKNKNVLFFWTKCKNMIICVKILIFSKYMVKIEGT